MNRLIKWRNLIIRKLQDLDQQLAQADSESLRIEIKETEGQLDFIERKLLINRLIGRE